MLSKRTPTRDTLRALINLEVAPTQKGLVAPNAVTLAQCAYEPGGYVWGLWQGERPVGLMAMVHPQESDALEPGDDPEGAFLWRLMIAAGEQGKGYGAAALDLVSAQARSWGLPRVVSSVVDAPHANLAFYTHHGFKPTGRIVDGEIEIMKAL